MKNYSPRALLRLRELSSRWVRHTNQLCALLPSFFVSSLRLLYICVDIDEGLFSWILGGNIGRMLERASAHSFFHPYKKSPSGRNCSQSLRESGPLRYSRNQLARFYFDVCSQCQNYRTVRGKVILINCWLKRRLTVWSWKATAGRLLLRKS